MTTYKRFHISFATGQLKKDMHIACMYSYNSKCSLILFYYVYIHYTIVCTDKIVIVSEVLTYSLQPSCRQNELQAPLVYTSNKNKQSVQFMKYWLYFTQI